MHLKQSATIDDERLLDRLDQGDADSSAPAAGQHGDQGQFRGLREMAIHQRNANDLAAHHGEK